LLKLLLHCVRKLSGKYGGNRYVTANAGASHIYRIDRKTGKTVLMEGGSEIEVRSESPPKPEIPSERAISKAKTGFTFKEYPTDNELWVRSQMENTTGELRIIGWGPTKPPTIKSSS
jgi:hypothetical protein